MREETVEAHREAIGRVTDFMRANLAVNYDQGKMAALAGYGRWYFSTIFVEHEGLWPGAYLRNLRLAEACRLLETTNMPIGDIGPTVGYESVGTFSAMFRRVRGDTPSMWRRRARVMQARSRGREAKQNG